MRTARATVLVLLAATALGGCARGTKYAFDPAENGLGRLARATAATRFAAHDTAARQAAARIAALAPATAADPTPSRIAALRSLHDTLADHTERIAAIEPPLDAQRSLNTYVDDLRLVVQDTSDLAVSGAQGLDTGTPRARLAAAVPELAPGSADVRAKLGLPPS